MTDVDTMLQETREKVKLLLQVADGLVEKGHVHATSIKSWVAAVDRRYKDFSCRMEKHRVKLETTLGLTHDVSLSLLVVSVLMSIIGHLLAFVLGYKGRIVCSKCHCQNIVCGVIKLSFKNFSLGLYNK